MNTAELLGYYGRPGERLLALRGLVTLVLRTYLQFRRFQQCQNLI
jgi:hypothetical protein